MKLSKLSRYLQKWSNFHFFTITFTHDLQRKVAYNIAPHINPVLHYHVNYAPLQQLSVHKQIIYLQLISITNVNLSSRWLQNVHSPCTLSRQLYSE